MPLMRPERMLARVASGERLFSDGAVGTELMRRGVLMEDLPRVALENPELLRSVHRDYIVAGADLITSHTFSWTFNVEATYEALRIAIEVSEDAKREIGVLFSLTERVDLVFLNSLAMKENQLPFLQSLSLIETCTSLEAMVFARTLSQILFEVPIQALSAHVRSDGTLLDGTPLGSWVETATIKGVEIIGINCGDSPASFPAIVRRMRDVTTLPLLVQPSLGLPQVDKAGKAFYTMTPDEFAEVLEPLQDIEGVIVGGCCGTTPAHIARLKLVFSERIS